jgi:Ca2+-binding EF-hand superfamily protein
LFAKVDADGSGSVDKTELQGMLDKMTGNTLGSSDDLMTKMDSDGDDSLSTSELDEGMKSLMPPPSSTVDFAQRGGSTPPPPPPGDGPPPGSGEASGRTSASSSTDLLDTNGDGSVSAEERAAGAVKDMVQDLFKAMDSDGDQSVSKSEFAAFKEKLDALFGASSTTASTTSSSISVTA